MMDPLTCPWKAISKVFDLLSRKLVLLRSIVDSRIDIRSRMSCEAISGKNKGLDS